MNEFEKLCQQNQETVYRYLLALCRDEHLAEELTAASQHLDEGEFLEAEAVPLETLVEDIMAGKIQDAKTQAAILKVWYLLEKQK